MKVRSGYVSNSSSSSFIIAYDKNDEDVLEFIDLIETLSRSDVENEVIYLDRLSERLREELQYYRESLAEVQNDFLWEQHVKRDSLLSNKTPEELARLRRGLSSSYLHSIERRERLLEEIGRNRQEIVELYLSYDLPKFVYERFDDLRLNGKIRVIEGGENED